jgi:hypothetical protein
MLTLAIEGTVMRTLPVVGGRICHEERSAGESLTGVSVTPILEK